MPDLLKRVFRPSDIDLPSVQQFTCGTEDWELEVSDWIKGKPGGVLDDMKQYPGFDVWLYGTPELGLIGFSSLSEPNWPYPNKGDPHPSIIPVVGIQTPFRGMPPGLREERYAWKIMDDLRNEAASHRERAPAIVLYVHPDNQRAIQFYSLYGFQWFSRTYKDVEKNVVYRSMILHL